MKAPSRSCWIRRKRFEANVNSAALITIRKRFKKFSPHYCEKGNTCRRRACCGTRWATWLSDNQKRNDAAHQAAPARFATFVFRGCASKPCHRVDRRKRSAPLGSAPARGSGWSSCGPMREKSRRRKTSARKSRSLGETRRLQKHVRAFQCKTGTRSQVLPKQWIRTLQDAKGIPQNYLTFFVNLAHISF
jgi:hypothetical protein